MRTSALTVAALAAGAGAQSTTTAASSAQTTFTALLGTVSGVAASVVSADGCGVTLALACTDTALCKLAPTVTITQGPSTYQAAFATSLSGVTGSFSESCALSGTTSAICHQTLSLSAPGTTTTESTVATLTGTQLNYQAIDVTANAAALSATTSTGKCTAATSSGKKGAAARPTAGVNAIREVYKVIVPVGAALLAVV